MTQLCHQASILSENTPDSLTCAPGERALPSSGTAWLRSPYYTCLLTTALISKHSGVWPQDVNPKQFLTGAFLGTTGMQAALTISSTPLRYFNEMSAQGLRPRTVSSPIPYTPSPSSSRPISPGEYVFSATSVSAVFNVALNTFPSSIWKSCEQRVVMRCLKTSETISAYHNWVLACNFETVSAGGFLEPKK